MDTRKPPPATMIRRLQNIALTHEAEASNANADVMLAREGESRESSGNKSNSLNQGSTERKRVPDAAKSRLYTKRLKQEHVSAVVDRQLYSKKMREQSVREAKARWLIKDVKENRVPWRRYDGTQHETYVLTQIRTLQFMCHIHRGPAAAGYHYRTLYFPFIHVFPDPDTNTVQHIADFITKNLQMFQEIDTLPPGSVNRRVRDLEHDDLDV